MRTVDFVASIERLTPSTVGEDGISVFAGRTRQKTLATPVRCTGVGLHGGSQASIVLRPAPVGTGILFRRTDIAADIPARFDRVVAAQMCTTLGNAGGVTVATVEHLMSAFAGCEIDNAIVEVDGPELPIMDGSAAPFVFLIECAGTTEQQVPRLALRITDTVEVVEGDKRVSLAPLGEDDPDGLCIAYTIAFDSRVIGRQEWTAQLLPGSFKADIARARTFGFLHEVEALRKAGLARGGSLDNAVVIDGDRVMNDSGLRFADEFVRHKVLDAIGDLALAGAPILGRYAAVKGSHALNNKLLRALFERQDAFQRVAL